MSATSLCRTTSWLVSLREVHVINAVQDVLDQAQAAGRPGRQVHLGDITGDHDPGAESEPGEEHLHLLG